MPFINGDIEDRYMTVGYKRQIGEWNADFSQTHGYNKLKYNISNTLNAPPSPTTTCCTVARAQPDRVQRRWLLVLAAHHQCRLQPFSSRCGERDERRLRCRVPARELPDLRR